MNKLLVLFLLVISSQGVYALPFDTCPSRAYLFQSKPVQVYGVNLVTGQTSLLQGDTGVSSNINSVGFDFEGRYIYGYDTTRKEIVRLGKNFQAETVNSSGLPSDYTFYVGDVFNKHYYLYRQGKGLFKIDLSPLDIDSDATLEVEQITNIASQNLTDFAFHPGNDQLYGIDNNSGYLYQFDTSSGESTYIGDTGQTGTFGAGYFDVNGYYYVARNQDGYIYRIDLSNQANINNGLVTAVKFADGPMSNQNDGARCANAPVIDEDSTIDFGDAPDTYQTTLANNGPRHQLDNLTWMGSQAPDGEQDGLVAPLSDNSVGINDEDGIGFVTAIEAGLDAIITVEASSQGYLSAWIDWNQDGDFTDDGEQVFSDTVLEKGNNTLFFIADIDAVEGLTWSRFRFSQQTNLSPMGGSTSGEVEDHQIMVISEGITVRHFPNETGYATLAYEDNWPYTADYDMNDVVIHYRITEVLKDGEIKKSFIKGRLAAFGADYHNGFAIRLPRLSRDNIDTSLTRQIHNDRQQTNSGLELDSNEAIFIVSNELNKEKGTDCRYFRTLSTCLENESFTFELHISIVDGISVDDIASMPYDPFIFSTPGYYHGEGLPLHPGRKWEVHLPDQSPTEKFDGDSMWGLGIDASDASNAIYFKTADNLPWALLITDEWQWPLERVDLVNAYPAFATYAESGGTLEKDWFISDKAVTNKIYQP
ncbi:LruC domain-containing protein [Vibrio sp. DW001]|uniref:LruC domain-containing protein n=1 Tax=Vibrio sp. DW001 TaxID=2912315 RepID=UPI0023AEA43C|nr:LruC domain-containing protein [Vibrio sp. DW001]WED28482.1 LruC domain-containing protein [Vibrio sp. DW001]